MRKEKSLIRNTAILYVRMLVAMLIGFFTSRILLNQLGVVDFGVYNVVGSIIVLLGFLNSTLSLSTQRFINFELGNNDFAKLRKVYSSSIVIHITFALLVFVVAETLGLWFLNNHMNIPEGRMCAANYVYHFSVLSAMLSLTMIPYTATMIAHEHVSQYATIGIVDVFLRFSVACMLFFIHADKLIVYALAMFLVVMSNYLMYYGYCKRHFEECKFVLSKDRNLYREMLSFSGWNVFSSISIVLNGQIVNIVLNLFFGPIVNAARGIASQVNGAIGGFVSNFQIAVNPRIIQAYAANNISIYFKLIYQSAKFSFFLLLVLLVPVWICVDDVLQLWLGTVPEYTADFCRIVFISSLINTFSLPLATAANATGNIRTFQLACGIFEILNIPMSYFFLKIGYSPISVYLVQISITVITLFVRLTVLRRLVKFDMRQFLLKIVARCLIVALLSFFSASVTMSFFEITAIWRLVTVIIFNIVLVCGWIALLGMDREEKTIVMNLIKNKLCFK